MAPGSVHKRCACLDEHGRRLGTRCPKLYRPGGGYAATHGVWAYQIELPPVPGGVRRQLRRSGFTTREVATAERDHAKALLALAGDDQHLAAQIGDMLRQVKYGRPLPDRDTVARRVRAGVPATAAVTVGEYLTDWLDGRKAIAESTRFIYGGHIRRYLIPHLGRIPLDRLRIAHIGAMFTAIEARNTDIRNARTSPDPKMRASVVGTRFVVPATMHRIRATLRKALNDAIRKDKLIEFNPAAHLELPSGKRPRARVWTTKAVARWRATGQRPSTVMVWTPDQAGAFLDHAERADPQLYPMFVLILHRGLRRGEACGIRDIDIDLDAATATIAQQIATINYTPVIKQVKSDAGERHIPLDPTTVTALRAYHTVKARQRLAAGAAWPDTGLFFTRPDGHTWHPDQVTARFYRHVAAADLPPIRLHDLRHCTATYLKATGADLKTIQETLGHSSITITADTYTSVLLDLERDSANAAANLIPRKPHKAA